MRPALELVSDEDVGLGTADKLLGQVLVRGNLLLAEVVDEGLPLVHVDHHDLLASQGMRWGSGRWYRLRDGWLLMDKRRIPLRSASVRTPHLFHHGIPKVLVNPQSKGITSA
jgi:hypothetical protein